MDLEIEELSNNDLPPNQEVRSTSAATTNEPTTTSSLPYACLYRETIQLFRLVRSRGKSLAMGGFGVIRDDEPSTTDGDSSVGKIDDEEGEQSVDLTADEEQATTTMTTATSRREHLFLEEVLFLHERGLLEVYHDSTRLESYDLYTMLSSNNSDNGNGSNGVSLAAYWVYAHLRNQSYRVVRHTPTRRSILLHLQDMSIRATGTSGDHHPESLQQQQQRRRRKTQAKNATVQGLRMALRRDAAHAGPPQLMVGMDSHHHQHNVLRPAFDVYAPQSNFPRSQPGLPDFSVAITTYNNPTGLAWDDLVRLSSLCDNCLKIACVSDSGTVVMFGVSSDGVPALK